MIELKNEKGSVFVSDTALSSITGAAATSCFGVKGMAYRSMTDGIVHLLRRAEGRAAPRQRKAVSRFCRQLRRAAAAAV